jgi:lipopolysaccharide export system permease protein
MAAGGIRPTRVLLPLLGMGMVATLGMLYFNDSVLPEANHRLKNLMMDIGRKSPTFDLREQVVNELRTEEGQGHYFLTADRIDRSTNTLENVTIFDRNNAMRQRTTYAARGVMAFNEARTDLYLTLYDGEVREVQGDREGGFQHVYFQKQIIPMRGVGDELSRRMGGADRGDREMDFATLLAEASARDAELVEVTQRNKARSVEAIRIALGRPASEDSTLVSSFRIAQAVELTGAALGNATLLARDPVTQNVVTATRTYLTQAQSLGETANRFRVELHKKWAIALACLVFTLIGPPLALRFPRGGVGMVVAASTGIFAIYWMGLIGGESLADRRVAGPVITMWISNAVFALVGLLLVSRMGRAGATVRGGGGWEEAWLRIRDRLTGLGRSRPGAAG